jgi:serine/threonine protein kinase
MNARTFSGAVFEVTSSERVAPDSTRTWVATKRVVAHLRSTPEARAALVREAGFLALASHPAVPRLLEVGNDADGPFIVEEWAFGLTLETVSARSSGPLPFHFAAHLTASVASAIRDLHAARDAVGTLDLVHGDPSPANVILAPDGRVRLIDFGESRFRGVEAPLIGGAGTPPFSAPELCRGEVGVSRETDVYAVGALAIRLFAGEPLGVETTDAARLVAIAERGIGLDVLRSARLPPKLVEALAELVAFRREDRQTSFDHLLDALDPLA